MVFGVPAVQLLLTPFDVLYTAPTSCNIGEVITISIEIRNKLWYSERLSVTTELNEDYIITGNQLG
jgi:hypothetical protein